jgi:hypothetical protein
MREAAEYGTPHGRKVLSVFPFSSSGKGLNDKIILCNALQRIGTLFFFLKVIKTKPSNLIFALI